MPHHSKNPRPLPRPTRNYDPEIDPLLVRWASQRQATLSDAAHRIGVPQWKLRQWITQYPQIAAAIHNGQRVADAKVIDALHKRCVGYKADEFEVESRERDKAGRPRKVKHRQRHLPADLRAILFWLKNRLPDQWSDRPEGQSVQEIAIRLRPVPQLPDFFDPVPKLLD